MRGLGNKENSHAKMSISQPCPSMDDALLFDLDLDVIDLLVLYLTKNA